MRAVLILGVYTWKILENEINGFVLSHLVLIRIHTKVARGIERIYALLLLILMFVCILPMYLSLSLSLSLTTYTMTRPNNNDAQWYVCRYAIIPDHCGSCFQAFFSGYYVHFSLSLFHFFIYICIPPHTHTVNSCARPKVELMMMKYYEFVQISISRPSLLDLNHSSNNTTI